MALDPESQRLIDLMVAADRPAWNTLSPKAARELYLSLRAGAQGSLPAGVKVVDRTIPGPAGELAVRIYRPALAAADAGLPGLVYAHGGGWVFGNLDSHDVLCAQFALEAGIAVFAIDYRLAPEARFPPGSPSAATAPAATWPRRSRSGRATMAGPSSSCSFSPIP